MKRPPAPRLVTVAIFTTITVIFWIFFSVYTVLTQTPDINVPPELLEPIDPTLDIEALEDISGRIHFEESDVTSPIIDATTPSPQPEASPIPEDSLEITPTATATPTGVTPTEEPVEVTPTSTEI
jgi:hypothetical protein